MSESTFGPSLLKDVITTGCVLAMIISWEENHSIPWAVLHSICNWFYVVYYVAVGG